MNSPILKHIGSIQLASELEGCWPEQAALFEAIMQTQGELYRAIDNRKTLKFAYQGQYYFIKKHRATGWLEIIKNLLFGRLPIIGAKDEFQALNRLQELSINAPIVVGFGQKGNNPARQESFLITREVRDVKGLDSYEQAWKNNELSWPIKQNIIKNMAHITRTLHRQGINHRDLYACHFMIKEPIAEQRNMTLMDLHRAQIRKQTPLRWIIKDLASLYYSMLSFQLTSRDLLRFITYYSEQPWQYELKQNRAFWAAVVKRTEQFVRRHKKFFDTPEPKVLPF